jgi:subtilisin
VTTPPNRRSAAVSAGFAVEHHAIITEIVAPDWPEFVRKSALRADSFLTRLSDRQFNRGMAAVRAHVDEIPSVLTVAAIDRALATASFSDRVTADAPGVKGPDLAGPGVDVYSAWPVIEGSFDTISGTSTATPHVAGIAALYAEANPTIRGQALKDLVMRTFTALRPPTRLACPHIEGRQSHQCRSRVL